MLDEMQAGWEACDPILKGIKELRDTFLSGPKPTAAVIRAGLDRMVIHQPPAPMHPWWLSGMCNCRGFLKMAAVHFEDADRTEWYLFLLAP